METCTNNLMTMLSILVGCKEITTVYSVKLIFRDTGFLCILSSTITNQIHSFIAYKNENIIDSNGQI